MKKLLSCLFAALFVLSSCNKDDVIEVDSQTAPRITLDSENAVYTIKSGRERRSAPLMKTRTRHSMCGKSTESRRHATRPTVCEQTVGELFVLLRVSNRYGTASEELRVDVVELEIPTISLPVPEKRVYDSGRQSSDAETLRNRHLDPHDLHMERERQRSFLRKGIYIRHVRSRRLYARIRHPQ